MKKLLLLPILICSQFPVFCQAFTAGTVFINYQDFNPDTLLSYTVAPYTNETYGISLFGDLANSIEFTAHGAASPGYSAAYIRVATVNPNIFFYYGRIDSVFLPTTNTWNITRIAMPLNDGDSIDAMNALWDSTMVYLTDHTYSDGGNKDVNDWIGGHKYLGVKYSDGPYLAYGWVKLHCVSEDSCYLKEFSFSELNISVGTKEVANNIMIYPNPINTHFYLNDINQTPLLHPGIRQ